VRILVVHNRYRSAQPSGENAVVDEESRLIAVRGHEVERLEVESDQIATWPVRRKALLPARVVWSREGYRLTSDAIKRFRPDVVHFHNTFPLLSPSALWAAHHSSAAVVQTLHNYRPLCPAASLLRDGKPCELCARRLPLPSVVFGCYRDSRLATIPVAMNVAVHRSFLRTWTRCVDYLIAPSAFTARKYIDAGWPEEKLCVKYNTASDGVIRPFNERAGVICLSRLTPDKGIDILIDAWRLAFPAGEEELLVVGSGDQELALREAARDLPHVTFYGQLEQPAALELLSRSRALVVPSRGYEVFPRTIIEAYARGVPAIASRIGSLPEVVERQQTGLLFEVGSKQDLADALRQIAADGTSERLGREARRAYDERYSPERTTNELLEIYGRAITRRAA
jgi:glycosyltransferase involved in cell wall biosynthesis